ncbi:adipolin [Tachysurus ichikawai]
MRLWLLASLAALLWSHCTLLEGAEAKKARKRPKEMPPQHTEVFNATLSNSEEEDESTKASLTPLCLGHPIGRKKKRKTRAAGRVSPSQSLTERVLKEDT